MFPFIDLMGWWSRLVTSSVSFVWWKSTTVGKVWGTRCLHGEVGMSTRIYICDRGLLLGVVWERRQDDDMRERSSLFVLSWLFSWWVIGWMSLCVDRMNE
jgi:hypothetical protein